MDEAIRQGDPPLAPWPSEPLSDIEIVPGIGGINSGTHFSDLSATISAKRTRLICTCAPRGGQGQQTTQDIEGGALPVYALQHPPHRNLEMTVRDKRHGQAHE